MTRLSKSQTTSRYLYMQQANLSVNADAQKRLAAARPTLSGRGLLQR